MEKKLALTILFNGAGKLPGKLKNIVGLGERGGQALGRMKREAKQLDQQLSEVRGELAAGSFAPGLVMRERELLKAVEDTNRQLQRREKLMIINGRVAKMHGQADRYMARGRENLFAGGAMLAPFAFAAKSAVDYEKQLTLLAQKTDLTAQQTKLLGRDLLAAARASKQMPDAIFAGADFLASKGVEVGQLRSLIPAIGRFATAWDSDVLDASKAAYANMLSLQVPAEQSARALQMMGVAGKRGGFEVKDMAKHFPILASQLATMGAKGLPAVASLSSALQVLEAKTGDGAMAASDLANMMRFTQTKQGIDNFKKFGIDIVAEMKRVAKEGGDPLERLAELTKKATGGDSSRLAQLFTDQQASRGALNLVNSIGQYRKIRDEAFAAQGVTAQEFDRMSASSAVNIQALMGSLDGLSMSLGTHLIPLLTRGADWLARTTNAVADWADRNPRLASTLFTVVGGMAAARVGLGAMQLAFGGMLKPAATAWGVYKKWKTAGSIAATFPKAAKAMGILRTASLFMAKGVMRAGMMMMANPMILAIIALVAVVGIAGYLIYKHWDTIKAAFYAGVEMLGQAWEWIKSTFNAGLSFLLNLHAKMLNIGKMLIVGLAKGILAAPGAVWNALKSVVMGGVEKVKNLLGIHSPSRVFMGIGGHITEGLAQGVDHGARRPIRSVGRLATGVAGAMAIGTTPATVRGAAAQSGAAPITINIHQLPGEDAQALAERVMKMLERRRGVDQRSAYYDGE